MKANFSKEFNDINFQFQRIYHMNKDLWYYISFNNNGTNSEFKMYKDAEGMWCIATQILPDWVEEMEMEFSEQIIRNENNEEIY